MHTHTAPSATRLQKIVEPAITQRHSDALTSYTYIGNTIFDIIGAHAL